MSMHAGILVTPDDTCLEEADPQMGQSPHGRESLQGALTNPESRGEDRTLRRMEAGPQESSLIVLKLLPPSKTGVSAHPEPTEF